MFKPTDNLFADALRVLYYLERTKDLGITYECQGDDLALYDVTDSGWAVKHSMSTTIAWSALSLQGTSLHKIKAP